MRKPIEHYFPKPDSLYGHPAPQDARRELVWIFTNRPEIEPAQAGKMIRVEMTHDVAYSIRMLCRDHFVESDLRGRPGAEMTIEGIDYYVVNRLPPDCPGYRVINPLRIC
ncbi:hypothetical protein GG804_26450 [Sphingomonas histidinilytica]|uniref:hypothetical protein n=1 Tax=Rhizorhabdus histidinilytica TaxID=439228 RepID=UPI001ADB7A80|nr:hypothetical protein [Rhizorhabdus histidinilytica]MBO9380311.1 hypothetical protein [Rhizorhabdus histidinilytica]